MAINKELGYSDETAALIERQCRNVERSSFRLQKDKATEAILKTYDLFDLPRPKRVVWFADIFNDQYQQAARSAGSAWSAGSAGSAWSAWSAGSAGSALDYDFNYYIFEYEYCQNPSEAAPNDNDQKYLEYCELLMQAKEYGAGYRIEWEDTLYIVPTPLVKIDSQNRFHSEDGTAIRWKQGKAFYYLYGENFDKQLWQRITSGTFTAQELMAIEDADKRSIAMTYLRPEDMIAQMGMKFIHTGIKGNKLYECKDYLGSGKTEYALWMRDASTPREFIHMVPQDYPHRNDADQATANMLRRGDGVPMALEDYLAIGEEA